MRVLGITGGIGSGKSFVCQRLTEEYGVPVYDCDREAKRLTQQSPQICQALQTLVGKEVYDEAGVLQKRILADYLFQSEEHQQKVDAIIHPAVKADFLRWADEQTTDIVALESAILIESGFYRMVTEVVGVTAPLPLRIERAMKRDNATAEQIESRIRLQLSDEARAPYCQHIIDNDGRDLTEQLGKIFLTEENIFPNGEKKIPNERKKSQREKKTRNLTKSKQQTITIIKIKEYHA